VGGGNSVVELCICCALTSLLTRRERNGWGTEKGKKKREGEKGREREREKARRDHGRLAEHMEVIAH